MTEIPGRYELAYEGGSLTLVIRADLTYTETIKEANRQQRTVAGRWNLKAGCVNFDSLIVPDAVVPDESNFDSAHGTPNWCLPAERFLWHTRLVINPDRNLAFNLLEESK